MNVGVCKCKSSSIFIYFIFSFEAARRRRHVCVRRCVFFATRKKNKRKKTILWVFSLFAYVHMGVYSYSIPASKHKVRRRDYHTQGNDSYSHLPHSTVLKAKRLFMRVNRSFHACCCYDVLVFPLYIFFLFSFTTLPPRPYRSGHSFIMH